MPSLLASLFRTDCVVLEAAPALVDDELYEEERVHIKNAIESRRAEFGTARLLARRAFARLGVAACPLVPAPNRAPTWPREVVGSITHCRGYVAVAVAKRDQVRSLGVDVETIRPLDDGVARMVLTERERLWALGNVERLVLVFSAKEAFYKCQYPITEQVLGFHDVELDVELSAGRFVATARVDLAESVRRLDGRFAFENGRVLSAVELSDP